MGSSSTCSSGNPLMGDTLVVTGGEGGKNRLSEEIRGDLKLF